MGKKLLQKLNESCIASTIVLPKAPPQVVVCVKIANRADLCFNVLFILYLQLVCMDQNVGVKFGVSYLKK